MSPARHPFNDGREHGVEVGQERWVRSRWHDLHGRSGLHFEGDYTSPDVP